MTSTALPTYTVIVLTLCAICCGVDVHFRMHEGNWPGVIVGNIVQAARLQRQGLTYFHLHQGTEYESHFAVDELTGILTAVNTIDRESVCEFVVDCELVLEVGGHSTNNDGYFTVIRVVVIVEDVNDNAPLFPKPVIHLPITESVLTGTTFTFEGARDADTSTQFSIQSYELVPKYTYEDLPFDLSFSKRLDGSSILKLNVTHHLNREDKGGYELFIFAKDGGSPSLNGSLFINITIEDVNDNYPIFERQSYNVTVGEDVTTNTVILKLTAFDQDQGNNARVTYRTSDHQSSENIETFTLDAVTGDLRVTKQLNYNTQKIYKLIIEATDSGEVPLTTQTFVQVNVKDIGNNPPEIYVNTLPSNDFAEISEYANLGAVVAHVAIIDNDAGNNGDVNCTVSNTKFGLQGYDVNEYKVILVDVLDRERDPYHTVTIICTDSGNPPLNTTNTFEVSVLDENDNAPKFKQQRYFTVINENNEIGDVLASVSATDFDTGNNSKLVYTVAPLSSEYAYVNSDTGVVMANKRFDKEGVERTGLSLTIYATDRGDPKLTGTTIVHVSIKDINDNGPVFVQPLFIFWIAENSPLDSFVGKIMANDSDKGINAKTKYSLNTSEDNLPFVVSMDGTIKTNREIDHELASDYTFQVIAVDSGNISLSSEATVAVIVEDVNDNAPVIHFPTPGNDTVHMPVMTPVDSLIYSVIASDRDESTIFNSMLIYSLTTPNKTNYFTISSSSGEIYLSTPLPNSDLIDKVFILTVGVRDQGQGSQLQTATLYVVITAGDVNNVVNIKYEKNVLIVIVVTSLTFVVSAVIIVTICLLILRRIDVHRTKPSTRLKVLSENTYFKGTNTVDTLSRLPPGVNVKDTSKKEVGFLLEENRALGARTFPHNNGFKHILLDVSDDDVIYFLLNNI